MSSLELVDLISFKFYAFFFLSFFFIENLCKLMYLKRYYTLYHSQDSWKKELCVLDHSKRLIIQLIFMFESRIMCGWRKKISHKKHKLMCQLMCPHVNGVIWQDSGWNKSKNYDDMCVAADISWINIHIDNSLIATKTFPIELVWILAFK